MKKKKRTATGCMSIIILFDYDLCLCMFDQAWYKVKKEKNEDEMIHELILLRKKNTRRTSTIVFSVKNNILAG